MASTKRDLVFEVLRAERLVVSCQTKFNPSDEEWDRWLAAVSRLEHDARRLRLLVFTEGGHPTKAQVERMRAVNRSNPPTAIVSGSIALRFLGSALMFINPTIRCFAPEQLNKAFDHLGLLPDERSGAAASAQGLQRELAAGDRNGPSIRQ